MHAWDQAPDLTADEAVSMLLGCLSSANVISTRSMLAQVRFAAPQCRELDDQLVEMIVIGATSRRMGVHFNHRESLPPEFDLPAFELDVAGRAASSPPTI